MGAVTVQRLHQAADAAATSEHAAREWDLLYARATEPVRRAYNLQRALQAEAALVEWAWCPECGREQPVKRAWREISGYGHARRDTTTRHHHCGHTITIEEPPS